MAFSSVKQRAGDALRPGLCRVRLGAPSPGTCPPPQGSSPPCGQLVPTRVLPTEAQRLAAGGARPGEAGRGPVLSFPHEVRPPGPQAPCSLPVLCLQPRQEAWVPWPPKARPGGGKQALAGGPRSGTLVCFILEAEHPCFRQGCPGHHHSHTSHSHVARNKRCPQVTGCKIGLMSRGVKDDQGACAPLLPRGRWACRPPRCIRTPPFRAAGSPARRGAFL